MEDTLLAEEATDKRRLAKLKNEALRGLRLPPAGVWKETVEIGRESGNFGEGSGARVDATENGRVMLPLAIW